MKTTNSTTRKVRVFIQNTEVSQSVKVNDKDHSTFFGSLAGGGGIHRPLNQPNKQRPGEAYKTKVHEKHRILEFSIVNYVL